MAQHFSTGSLKVQQYVGSLIAKTWSDEWQALLRTSPQSVERALEQAELDGIIDKLSEQIPLSDSPVPRAAGLLSGTARREEWSIRRAVEHLASIAGQALQALREGNVVRAKPAPSGVIYELVHDGFGPAFREWAAQEQEAPLDALAAITAQLGLTLGWERLAGTVKDACWRGCWIGPREATGELVIDRVDFTDCDLRGTLFDHCVFSGGGFRRCELDGVIFRNCVVEPAQGTPFCFQDVTASALAFSGGSMRQAVFQGGQLHKMSWGAGQQLAHVVVEDCAINQLSVESVEVGGPIKFRRSWLVLSDLAELSTAADKISFSECKLAICRLHPLLNASIQRDPTNVMDPEEWGTVAGVSEPWHYRPQ
jgi:hypothetical protein